MNKRTMCQGNRMREHLLKSRDKDFRQNFLNAFYQTNWSEISNSNCTFFFGIRVIKDEPICMDTGVLEWNSFMKSIIPSLTVSQNLWKKAMGKPLGQGLYHPPNWKLQSAFPPENPSLANPHPNLLYGQTLYCSKEGKANPPLSRGPWRNPQCVL